MSGAPNVINQQTQHQVLPSVWHFNSKGSTSVKVNGINVVVFSNSGAQNLTSIIGGQPNQRILFVGDGVTTIVASSLIITSDGLNKLLGFNETCEFILLPTGVWLELTQASGGGGGGGVSQVFFANVVWGTPGSEASNAIEVNATTEYLDGTSYASGLVAVRCIVSDSPTDSEPSATAIINAATAPVGTLLAGGGTATAEFITNSSGEFRIRVTETAVADRYIWVKAGGHYQLYVKAKNGLLQLTFA